MKNKKEDKLSNLDFEKFRNLAKDETLSRYEKIGFYDSLRKMYEEKIFVDIFHKLTNLQKNGQTVMDIGCGCSGLPRMILEHARDNHQHLIMVDSKEMLKQLPEESFVKKITCRYPDNFEKLFGKFKGKTDVILCYSVFHYIVNEMVLTDFLDHTLSLLNHGGQLLIGDIPNFSKRNRFFASPEGIAFHQRNNKTKKFPLPEFNSLPSSPVDDALIFFILERCRNAGYESYLLPQPGSLPMANRREDILIVKP